jgi:hypothetical protein
MLAHMPTPVSFVSLFQARPGAREAASRHVVFGLSALVLAWFNSDGLWQGLGARSAGDPQARLARWREVLAKSRLEGLP